MTRYTRVDVLQGDRQVRIEVDGVRMDLLRPTDTHTECPYKGTADYYDLVIDETTYEDFVWWYPTRTIEAAKIVGYVCFYNEKADLYVDGELQERPDSPFR